jgi:hypothetical protein
MVQTLAISKSITTLADVGDRFNLTPTDNKDFFTEWHQDLLEITDEKKSTLDKLKHRFLRHRRRGDMAEGTINLLLVSPLLELAVFLR